MSRNRIGLPRIPKNTIVGNNGDSERGEPPFALSTSEVADLISNDLHGGNGLINPESYYEATDSGYQFAINRAIEAAADRGGGTVIVPNIGTTYTLTGKIVLRSNVRLIGYGRPKLALANNVNESIIEGLNYQSLVGTLSNSNTVDTWTVENFYLDGNRAYNTGANANSGHGLAVYGRNFYARDLYIENTYRRGVTLEYTNGSNGVSPFNGRVDGITTTKTGTEGIYLDISDLHLDNVNVRSPSQLADNTYDAIYIKSPIHGGARINVWRGGSEANTHRYSLYIGEDADTTRIAGAVLETAKTANIYIGCDNGQVVARSYNCLGTYHAILNGHSNNLDFSFFTGALPGVATLGLKLGDTIASRSNIIKIVGSGTTAGIVDFANTGGMNFIEGGIQFSGTDTLWANTPGPLDDVKLTASATTVTDRRSIWKLPADTNTMVAFGTTFSNATNIRHAVNKVTTNDSSGNNGVKLPNAISGQVHIITNYNDPATKNVVLNVYPHSSGKFVAKTANEGVAIPAGETWIFVNVGFDWAIIKGS